MNQEPDNPSQEVSICGYCLKRYPQEHANCNDPLCDCEVCGEKEE